MTPPAQERCWTHIGVWGDGSCPELGRVGHCRNCEVYTSGGRRLLDRAVPTDYIESWTTLLAQAKESEGARTAPFLVFRVGQSWLGLRALSLREITQPGTIRRVPHRPPDLVLGLTTVRGEIHPCLSLHALVGEAVAEVPTRTARFLVARDGGHDWVFPVDEVHGIVDVAEADIQPLPMTLVHASSVYTSGIVECERGSVGLLDEALVFAALERRMA